MVGALVSQQPCAVQWWLWLDQFSLIVTGPFVILSSGSRLQRASAWVVVKFDLPPSEAAYHAPAVAFCKLSDLLLGHFSKNSKLRRLCYQVLGLNRQYLSDLGS